MAGLQQGQVREGLEGLPRHNFTLVFLYSLLLDLLLVNHQLKFAAGEYILKLGI